MNHRRMVTVTAVAIGAAAVFGTGAALAKDVHDWHTAPGAVTCRYYTSMAEAQKSRNDPRWFAETGCSHQAGGTGLSIIEAPQGLAAMQVRLHGEAPETVWIHPYEVLGHAMVLGKRQGPMHYLDAMRADYTARQKIEAQKTEAKIEADRAELHARQCAETPELVRATNAALLRSGNTFFKDCP